MNVRFLEAFVWVAKLGSFKAAADKMHTTQAGISSRIATLEQQFGVKLFDREHRGVLLTSQGTELMPYAERMIETQARMMAAMGQADAFSGMLRIGVIETVVHTWLPDLLSRFAEKYPNATLELISDITPRLRDDLLRGVLDCAILSDDITPGFIENRRIATFAMRWVASPGLALKFPARSRLSFADIAEQPIISFHRESGVYRNIAQNAGGCANLRVSYFSSLGAMVDLTRSGFGTALLPLAVIQQDLSQGRLVALDVDPVPIALPVVASVRLEPASPLAEALVDMAQAANDQFVAGSRDDVLAP
jgi:DNA-binding transcriptional LysR family regulator